MKEETEKKSVTVNAKTTDILKKAVAIGKKHGIDKKTSLALYVRYNHGDLLDPVQASLFEAMCKIYADCPPIQEYLWYDDDAIDNL